jgi:hypothetical protein
MIPRNPLKLVVFWVEIHVIVLSHAQVAVQVGEDDVDSNETQVVLQIDIRLNLRFEGRIGGGVKEFYETDNSLLLSLWRLGFGIKAAFQPLPGGFFAEALV